MTELQNLKIEGTAKGNLQKRTVFAGILITATCPWCGGTMTADLATQPINYPEINANNLIYLMCEPCYEAEHPDAVIKVPVFLSIQIQVAKPEAAVF